VGEDEEPTCVNEGDCEMHLTPVSSADASVPGTDATTPKPDASVDAGTDAAAPDATSGQ
jgi:hypothetical protein